MSYPATFTLDPPETITNWRPLVQWLLAIPHFVVAYVINLIAALCMLVAWFAIVITGRMPQGLADVIAMANRYQLRIMAYAGFLHEEYPPFDFSMSAEDPGGQPVRVDFSPAIEDRNRLTVGLRILWAIPAAIFSSIIMFVAQILWFIALFAVLFTGRWPEGMRNFVESALRVNTRTTAYVTLLTDEYPPFDTA